MVSYITATFNGRYSKIFINGVFQNEKLSKPPNNVIRNFNYIGKSNWAVDSHSFGLNIYGKS